MESKQKAGIQREEYRAQKSVMYVVWRDYNWFVMLARLSSVITGVIPEADAGAIFDWIDIVSCARL